MNTSPDFLREVEGYLAASGMKPTTFGKAALRDPRFVATLRAGRSPTLETVDRVRSFIRDHPPAATADEAA